MRWDDGMTQASIWGPNYVPQNISKVILLPRSLLRSNTEGLRGRTLSAYRSYHFLSTGQAALSGERHGTRTENGQWNQHGAQDHHRTYASRRAARSFLRRVVCRPVARDSGVDPAGGGACQSRDGAKSFPTREGRRLIGRWRRSCLRGTAGHSDCDHRSRRAGRSASQS